jgi:CheY-like chemotaxis protein
VQPLAAQRQVNLRTETPAGTTAVSVDPLLAQHVLLSTISRALGQAQPGAFDVTLRKREQTITLSLHYILEAGATGTIIADSVIAQLADRLGWVVDQSDRPDGTRVVVVQMAAQGPTVLVIDDNEGLVTLLQRYLTDQACQVVAATDGIAGLSLAQELRPDAIVLDVMMPATHGWEVLQRLRADKRLSSIPVIICSVINNPDLAQALGASMFLAKPVRQDDILSALSHLQIL